MNLKHYLLKVISFSVKKKYSRLETCTINSFNHTPHVSHVTERAETCGCCNRIDIYLHLYKKVSFSLKRLEFRVFVITLLKMLALAYILAQSKQKLHKNVVLVCLSEVFFTVLKFSQ